MSDNKIFFFIEIKYMIKIHASFNAGGYDLGIFVLKKNFVTLLKMQ